VPTNYPFPDVVITPDSGVEVAKNDDLIRTWYGTECNKKRFVETIFGVFIGGEVGA